MVHAFIMVQTEAGASQSVCDAILDLDHIQEAHVVAGEYDVIAESDGDDVGDVLGTASNEIQALDAVVDTKTYISLSA